MYLDLIRASKTFEDVVSVWPASHALREKICVPSTALTALDERTIAAIKDDNAGAGSL